MHPPHDGPPEVHSIDPVIVYFRSGEDGTWQIRAIPGGGLLVFGVPEGFEDVPGLLALWERLPSWLTFEQAEQDCEHAWVPDDRGLFFRNPAMNMIEQVFYIRRPSPGWGTDGKLGRHREFGFYGTGGHQEMPGPGSFLREFFKNGEVPHTGSMKRKRRIARRRSAVVTGVGGAPFVTTRWGFPVKQQHATFVQEYLRTGDCVGAYRGVFANRGWALSDEQIERKVRRMMKDPTLLKTIGHELADALDARKADYKFIVDSTVQAVKEAEGAQKVAPLKLLVELRKAGDRQRIALAQATRNALDGRDPEPQANVPADGQPSKEQLATLNAMAAANRGRIAEA